MSNYDAVQNSQVELGNLARANSIAQSLNQRRSQSHKRANSPITEDLEQANTIDPDSRSKAQQYQASSAKKRAKSHTQDDWVGTQQMSVLPQDYFLESLSTYLKQQVVSGTSDGFIKVYDLRKALLQLNCQGVSADDVENLTNVLASNLLDGAVLVMHEDGASKALVSPGSGTFGVGYEDVSDQFFKIDDVVANLKVL